MIGLKKAKAENMMARFPVRESELDRFKFGRKAYSSMARLRGKQSLLCLDVACGAKPFPNAHVLCDLNLKRVPDRSMRELKTEGKPFVLCDCRYLPFTDKVFDFVTSFYLIEHIDDPARTFSELKRVSEHGFIQCPSWFNELLYGEKVHKWIIIKREGRLYVKSLKGGGNLRFKFSSVFQKLYRNAAWRVFHAMLDETFHLFTIHYEF